MDTMSHLMLESIYVLCSPAEKKKWNQAWMHNPIILASGKLRQKDLKFELSLKNLVT